MYYQIQRTYVNSQKENVGKTLLFIVKIYDAVCIPNP